MKYTKTENILDEIDWDIDRRIKNIGEVSIIKSNLFHHENHNLKKYIIKKSYYASNFDNYFKKWGFDEITKKQFGFYYRYFGVFIEKGKWKKLFAHPLLSFSMYFLLFLRGCVFIIYFNFYNTFLLINIVFVSFFSDTSYRPCPYH